MDETFNPAALNRSDTLISTTGSVKAGASAASKSTKPTQNFPRIDYEPLYNDLKSLITENWMVYIDSVGRLLQGESIPIPVQILV